MSGHKHRLFHAPGIAPRFIWPGLAACALVLVALLSASNAGSQAQASFAHPAFKTAWDRTDALAASGAVSRPWVWGPVPGRNLTEPFAGIPGNAHIVQYFDKGRMEVNNPTADPTSPFYVTNGLLAVDLISGNVQTGITQYDRRAPAAINLASDVDDPSAPTYQSFNGVASIPGAPNNRRAASQVGQVVRTAIDRQGVTQPWPQDHPDYGVRIAHYEEVTGHNVPDVFWSYLNQQTDIIQGGQRVRGPLFFPWFAVSGYPISEPYWSYVKVAGRYTDVLIQAFERRVLTYVPHLPSPFKVQMGNIGQHYYDWRYLGSGGPGGPGGVSTPTSVALPPRASVTIDGIAYRTSITDINGTYATLTNRGNTAVSFDGWWLDSPKWNWVDRFYFPGGIRLAPGASLRVRSGPGTNTATDIYMFRTSVMWDRQLYDLAVLYDNYGREVDRFFPASDVGVSTPTRPPITGTATLTPAVTRTGTPGVPSPVQTGVATSTPPRTSVTPSPAGSTTPTTATVTATPTQAGSGECPTVDPSRMSRIDATGNVYIYNVVFKDEEEVEIYNDSSQQAAIGGWRLRDKNAPARQFVFPAGSVIDSDDSVFVYTQPGYEFSFNSQTEIWDDCGAALELLNANGVVVATYAYGNHLIFP